MTLSVIFYFKYEVDFWGISEINALKLKVSVSFILHKF